MIRDVGTCKPAPGNTFLITREWLGQGYCFRSLDAFKNRPNDPCYVPELSDTVYTAEDFLRICNGQKDFAEELFLACDWAHPETVLDERILTEQWLRCPGCGSLINYGFGYLETKCEKCGKEIGEV